MRPTRSLRLLVACAAFCAGLVLGGSTAGTGALAARTAPTLSPPTALWKAYPLRQRPDGTGTRSTPRAHVDSTRPVTARPTSVHGEQTASAETSGTGGFPIVLAMAGVIGFLLVSGVMVLRQAVPARAASFQSVRTARARRSAATLTRRRKASPTRRLAPVEPQELGPLEWERDPPLAIDERETIDAVGEQSCEIRLWRGYVKCQLYVELEGVPGALAESPLFRLRNPLTPDDRARRELSQLLAGLERQGWTVVETGPVWYRRRLERRESPSR
jgi:hypothetical protein